MTSRFVPDLIDVEQELFELPQKVRGFRVDVQTRIHDFFQERVIYNKEVQTATTETESPDAIEQEIRQRILKERDAEAEQAARDKELEEESVQLEKEIEREIRGESVQILNRATDFMPSTELSEEERASIFSAPEFLDFVEQSSKIIQRALNDGYDYIRDYTVGTKTGA